MKAATIHINRFLKAARDFMKKSAKILSSQAAFGNPFCGYVRLSETLLLLHEQLSKSLKPTGIRLENTSGFINKLSNIPVATNIKKVKKKHNRS
jgi:hypothetical protein